MEVTAKRSVEIFPISEDAIIRHGRGVTTVFRAIVRVLGAPDKLRSQLNAFKLKQV